MCSGAQFQLGMAALCVGWYYAYRQDATSSVQSVTVLADEVFHQALVLELNKCHVRGGRDGLQRAHGSRGSLSALGLESPCSIRAPEVWDASRRRDACSSKHDEVFALSYQVGELLRFLVDFARGLYELRERHFACCPGHVCYFRMYLLVFCGVVLTPC